MYFRTVHITRGTDLSGSVFTLDDPKSGMRLRLSERDKNAIKEPTKATYAKGDGICEVVCERRVSARLEDAARSIGTVSAKKGAVVAALREMDTFMETVVRLIRWRKAQTGEHDAIRFALAFEWSLDEKKWTPVADNVSLRIEGGIPENKWSDTIAASVR
jgi:hypothetical protein